MARDESFPYVIQIVNTMATNWHQILRRKEKNPSLQGFDVDAVPLILVDSKGYTKHVKLSTSYFTSKLELRYRDLIVVDPMITVQVATVLFIRPKAIVVNCDVGGHIRAIICENQVFILEVPGLESTMMSSLPTLDHPFVQYMSRAVKARRKGLKAPLELVALEAALSTAVGILTQDVDRCQDSSLEKIEAMLCNVNRGTLEGIRMLKHGLNGLIQKVSRLQMEIQEIMDDDNDMADLYLSNRRKKYGDEKPPVPSKRETFPIDEEEMCIQQSELLSTFGATPSKTNKTMLPNTHYAWLRPSTIRRNKKYRKSKFRKALNDPDQALLHRRAAIRQKRTGMEAGVSQQPGSHPHIDPHEIEEAEDLLETVFVDLDLLSRRLLTIDDKIEDAEELLELDLDSRRNELVGLNLIVATVAMAFGFAAVIAGIFGMNLVNSDLVDDGWVLPVVLVVTLVFSIGLILAVFLYVKHRKLMFIPTSI